MIGGGMCEGEDFGGVDLLCGPPMFVVYLTPTLLIESARILIR